MFYAKKTLLTTSFLLIVCAVPQYAVSMSVTLTPSASSPAPVGTVITFNAAASGASAGTLWYRFRVRWILSPDFLIVRDSGPLNTLDWTASEHEGAYQIEVEVRNRDTGELTSTTQLFEWTPRVLQGAPVISTTSNPLVFLYSAPPCPIDGKMRVTFQSTDGSVWNTSAKPCVGGLSMNFYIAGVQANSLYFVQHTVERPFALESGPIMNLIPPKISFPIPGNPLPIPTYTVLSPPDLPLRDGILLQATLVNSTVATDLFGNLVWYYPGRISYMTRPQPGGSFFAVFDSFGADTALNTLREFDLAGNTIRETNAARINEQLSALGKRQIGAFHHEATVMPDGRVVALASSEQLMTDIQGPGQVDVIGDVILVLDRNLQVVWTWDSFEHINWYQKAVLGEVCTQQGGGCPSYFLAKQANDWTHGNAVQLTPDGNLLYSARHQDWIIKIDYRGGLGKGDIIWRLGQNGDFQINSSDPNPWFSHQHDPGFLAGDNAILMVFDNGNTRHAIDGNAHSRGQVLQLDEKNHVASFLLNADLGGYSQALGSAAKLPNGNYHFNLGILGGNSAQSVEVDPSGNIVYAIQVSSPDYRTFRMRDLYTPPDSQSQNKSRRRGRFAASEPDTEDGED